METKKYVSLNNLTNFLDNLKNIFTTRSEVVDIVSTAMGTKPDNILRTSMFSGVYPSSVESITWFDSSDIKSEYLITSADMLAEFAFLVNQGYTFTNCLFKLDVDIIWNPYLFNMDTTTGIATYNNKPIDESNMPYFWIPIGERWATAVSNPDTTDRNVFDGNFDGQGHSISGLYLDDTYFMGGLFSCFKGNYIKNLSIVNSYLKTAGYSGSFAGFIDNDNEENGDIELKNLYTSAYLCIANTGSNAYNIRSAGIAGMMRNIGDITVNKCWFDGIMFMGGTHSTTHYAGGLFGVICKDAELNETVLFENCLMTGSIYKGEDKAPRYIGGIVGDFYCSLDTVMNNCLVDFRNTNVFSDNPIGIGAIVGYLENAAAFEDKGYNVLNTSNCYYVSIEGFTSSKVSMPMRIAPYGIVNGKTYTGEVSANGYTETAEIATQIADITKANLDSTIFKLDQYQGASLVGLRNVNDISPTPVIMIEKVGISTDGDVYRAVHEDGTTESIILEYGGLVGLDGKDGYTPIRGVDYWTEADKTEIINAVLEALST